MNGHTIETVESLADGDTLRITYNFAVAVALKRGGQPIRSGTSAQSAGAVKQAGTVASMPLEWLLLETDAPDQPDAAHRGERNEPARLPNVLAVVARHFGVAGTATTAAETMPMRAPGQGVIP